MAGKEKEGGETCAGPHAVCMCPSFSFSAVVECNHTKYADDVSICCQRELTHFMPGTSHWQYTWLLLCSVHTAYSTTNYAMLHTSKYIPSFSRTQGEDRDVRMYAHRATAVYGYTATRIPPSVFCVPSMYQDQWRKTQLPCCAYTIQTFTSFFFYCASPSITRTVPFPKFSLLPVLFVCRLGAIILPFLFSLPP